MNNAIGEESRHDIALKSKVKLRKCHCRPTLQNKDRAFHRHVVLCAYACETLPLTLDPKRRMQVVAMICSQNYLAHLRYSDNTKYEGFYYDIIWSAVAQW